MKKFVVLFALVFCAASGAWAQSYVFVNSETIFKSQADYNSAIKQLDDLSAEYQKNIDDAYAELDETFNNYAAQRGYLSETSRQNREEQIVNREKEIKKYQQDVFGPEGELMKKRIELIKPIQERVSPRSISTPKPTIWEWWSTGRIIRPCSTISRRWTKPMKLSKC